MAVNPNPVAEPQLAAQLRKLMNQLKAQYLHHQGKMVDYTGLRTGLLWGELEARISDLRLVNPTKWPEQTQRSFWINLYNVLVLHAAMVHGHPGTHPLRQLAFFLRKNWLIGGYRWSLDDIEHGILRGNRRNPFLPLPPFGPRDPRRQLGLSLDARVHFALNCGAKSCPPIGVYSAEHLEEQLNLAAASYLRSEVEFRGQTLKLPRLLLWYQADFGGQDGVAGLLAQNLGYNVTEVSQMRWVYGPYDWRINAL